MRKILITGGCGFAGHHLIEHLLKNTDDQMVALDSLSHAGRVSRVTDIESYDPDRVKVMWHDLNAPLPDHKWLDDVTDVLHLAAKSHVDRSISDPVPFVSNNVMATLNMLEWARGRVLDHFVQISTDEVYGPAERGHAHKEWESHIPSNPYAASKAAQGSIAVSYWRTYNLPIVITHTMNLYGERQHPEKFLPMTVKKVLEGEKVTLHARKTENGWEPSSRHWLHARNHADALLWVLNRPVTPYSHRADRPDCWHVAGEERDVQWVAERVAQVLDQPLRLEFTDFHSSRPGHDHRYALDGSRVTKAGWTPPVDIEHALDKTIQWMVENPRWLKG